MECGVVPSSEEELQELVEAADTDGDGEISFDEFAAIVRDQLTRAANAPPAEEEGEDEDGDGLAPLAPLTRADKTRIMLSIAKQLLVLLQVRPDWWRGWPCSHFGFCLLRLGVLFLLQCIACSCHIIHSETNIT